MYGNRTYHPYRVSDNVDPPRRGRPPRLAREDVLRTALELVDREGTSACTVRRVAEELAVPVMTLYGYVRNRDELVEGIALLAVAELDTTEEDDGPCDVRLRAAVLRLHRVARRYPDLLPLVLDHPARAGVGASGRDAVQRTLREAGFDAAVAKAAFGALTALVLGDAAVRAAPRYAGKDAASDAAFGLGLDLLLDGLRRRAQTI